MSSSVPKIADDLRQAVDQEIDAALPAVRAFRHERHQTPELTWKETATAEAVATALDKIPGLKVQRGVAKLGVVATLKGDAGGPTVALRADMDALPIEERTGVAYCSKHAGVMHACGHDGHMANLLGSAIVLSRLKSRLRGTVKFIFQPAEEGGAGARAMCDDGALKNPDVDMIFGLHGWPELEVGKVFVKDGPFMAAHAEVRLTVKGTGCHAAMPHLGTDQILASARLIDALQTVSSRIFAPVEPVALTIATIHAGKAFNVIPPEVAMTGSLRTVTKASEELAVRHIRTIAAGIAQATGTTIDVELLPSYPAVVNHAAPTAMLAQVAAQALGAAQVVRMPAPTMAAEDFAFFLERCPGSYFFLGVNDRGAKGYPSLHDPHYDFNDKSLPTGMRVYAHLALAAADYR
jgi:amidohydrolase